MFMHLYIYLLCLIRILISVFICLDVLHGQTHMGLLHMAQIPVQVTMWGSCLAAKEMDH